MSMMHDPRTDARAADSPQREGLHSTPTTTEGWTPDDRAPSAAENNFMSFALFGFLIIFGVGCFILF